jgi:hypothetical protein
LRVFADVTDSEEAVTIHRVDICGLCGKPVIDGEPGWTNRGSEVPPVHGDRDDCERASAEEPIETNVAPSQLGAEGIVEGRSYVLTRQPPEVLEGLAGRPLYRVVGVFLDASNDLRPVAHPPDRDGQQPTGEE